MLQEGALPKDAPPVTLSEEEGEAGSWKGRVLEGKEVSGGSGKRYRSLRREQTGGCVVDEEERRRGECGKGERLEEVRRKLGNGIGELEE